VTLGREVILEADRLFPAEGLEVAMAGVRLEAVDGRRRDVQRGLLRPWAQSCSESAAR